MKKKDILNKIDRFLESDNTHSLENMESFLYEVKLDLKNIKVCKLSKTEYNNYNVDTKRKVYKCGKCARLSNNKKQVCKPYKYK